MEGGAASPGFVDQVVVDQHLAPEEWQKAGGGTMGSERAGTDTRRGTMRASEEDSVLERDEPGDAFGPVGRLCMGFLWPKMRYIELYPSCFASMLTLSIRCRHFFAVSRRPRSFRAMVRGKLILLSSSYSPPTSTRRPKRLTRRNYGGQPSAPTSGAPASSCWHGRCRRDSSLVPGPYGSTSPTTASDHSSAYRWFHWSPSTGPGNIPESSAAGFGWPSGTVR